jgi:hypothetical protein
VRRRTEGLPQNCAAERALLGSILLDNACLKVLEGEFERNDLYLPSHRIVYGAIVRIVGRGDSANLVTICEELERTGQLDKAGGGAYMAGLSDGVAQGDYGFLRSCAKVVKRKAALRHLINLLQRGMACAVDEEDPGEIVTSVTADLAAIHFNGTGTSWRDAYETVDQMVAHGPVRFAIENFLMEGGVTMLGAPTGHGKTWVALSMVKALATGKNFLGLSRFAVQEIVPVLYLVPELSSEQVAARAAKLGIPNNERVLFRTLNKGDLPLDHPFVVNPVRELRPVVFCDPLMRFTHADDERSAAQNQGLVKQTSALLRLGARAIFIQHHSTKASAQKSEMTLENTFAGTWDYGGMARVAYGLRMVDKASKEIKIACLKPGDFPAFEPFHIRGKPYLDLTGEFGVLTEPSWVDVERERTDLLLAAIEANREASYRDLTRSTRIAVGLIAKLAEKAGWFKEGSRWQKR